MVSRLFRVKGVFRFGSAEIDGFLTMVHLDAAQELLGKSDVSNRVTVHLTDAGQSQDAARTADQLLARGDLDVRWWREALPELWTLIQVDRISGDVMLAILGLIVAMGVLTRC